MSGHVRTSQGPQIHLGPQGVNIYMNSSQTMWIENIKFNQIFLKSNSNSSLSFLCCSHMWNTIQFQRDINNMMNVFLRICCGIHIVVNISAVCYWLMSICLPCLCVLC